MKYLLLFICLNFLTPNDVQAQTGEVNSLEVFWEMKFLDFSEYQIRYISGGDTLRPKIEQGAFLIPIVSLDSLVTIVVTCRGRTIDFPNVNSYFLMGNNSIRVMLNSESLDTCVEVTHLYGGCGFFMDIKESDCLKHHRISLRERNWSIRKNYIPREPNNEWKDVPLGTPAEYEK